MLYPKSITMRVSIATTLVLIASSLSGETTPQLLTDAEATAIVVAQEEAKVASYQAKLAKLSNVEVVNTRTVDHNGQQLIINAIKPPVLEAAPEPETEQGDATTPAEFFSEAQEFISETISMGGNVYGNEHSKITWRDSETGATFVVWSNVSLNFLRPMMSFKVGDYDYNYFGFVTSYTREMDEQRQQFAAEHGAEVEPLWEEPPVSFTEEQYEYYVETDDSSQIPEKLYRQLDAIFGHYLANKEAWEVEYHNSQKLAEKRKEYLEANPPVPQPTVINFWKIED
jgi:hypothetical protein